MDWRGPTTSSHQVSRKFVVMLLWRYLAHTHCVTVCQRCGASCLILVHSADFTSTHTLLSCLHEKVDCSSACWLCHQLPLKPLVYWPFNRSFLLCGPLWLVLFSCHVYGACMSCMYVSLCHAVCVCVLSVNMCVVCVHVCWLYVSVCIHVRCVCECAHVHTQSEVAGRPLIWVHVNTVVRLHVHANTTQNCLMLHFSRVPCSSAVQGCPCTLKPQVHIVDFPCRSDAHL